MLQNNSLLAQLKQDIRSQTPRVTGTIKATDKSYGFMDGDDGNSYFIPPPHMKNVIHGDRVEAALHTENERQSVEPEVLLEPGLSRFIGRVKKREGRVSVVPDHPSIRNTLSARLAKQLDDSTINDGDWVEAKLLRHPLKPDDRSFYVQVEALIAPSDAADVPWRVTLARHALEQASPSDKSEWPLLEDSLAREDLTDRPFFTIDSASTQDMDDALCIRERDEGGWVLTVAIADPTAYVQAGDSVDLEARQRAFTVYLPGQNVTMLPETLANDLCSLKEDQVRPALACDITVAADGSIEDHRFFAAHVTSKAKLSYDNVSNWLEGTEGATWTPDFDHGESQLKALEALTHARYQWRLANALVFADRPDYAFELDEVGNVLAIHAEPRRIAMRMIEESMILANICCAKHLAEHVGHGIYNVHTGVAPEKRDQAVEFLATQGVEATPDQLGELERFTALRRSIEAKGDAWLDARLRRFQGYVTITATPGPHFGMGLEAYATWTSPIRKYGDMINHRLLKQTLAQGETALPAAETETETEHLTERRRLNRMAERDVKDWLYVRFLREAAETNQPFDAEIMDIKRGGMRVRLLDNGATVFMPSSTLHSDKTAVAIDDKDGIVRISDAVAYRLGDAVRIELSEAREDTRSLIGRPAAAQ
ncbi:exoribonuclease II [Larsenimonas suaedae]|uniref:Exoribonuclease II n=1 Tax=Larsenimonas suaedae TaxID=1851019 RepID=A0ABU1GV50_9GAMM|nr:exoribonuclease II [Larsenimonas suaedae]MCM2971210.1 exoribonuclease II [Larsenimonas suaedae]MDR5895919.1 exoribonuclease II [Larsenimonas suaedae]